MYKIYEYLILIQFFLSVQAYKLLSGQLNGPMGDGNQLKDIAFPILDDEMSQQIRAMITGEQTQVAMNGVSIKNGLNNNQVCAV